MDAFAIHYKRRNMIWLHFDINDRIDIMQWKVRKSYFYNSSGHKSFSRYWTERSINSPEIWRKSNLKAQLRLCHSTESKLQLASNCCLHHYIHVVYPLNTSHGRLRVKIAMFSCFVAKTRVCSETRRWVDWPAAVAELLMPLPVAAAAAAGCGKAPLAIAVSEPTVTCGDDNAATGLRNVEPCAAAATNAACWLTSCCNRRHRICFRLAEEYVGIDEEIHVVLKRANASKTHYTVSQKNWATFLRPITLEIFNRSLTNWA